MKKNIMILGASILQLPAIIQAKKLGYKVFAVDMDKDAIGFKYADEKIVKSTNDIDGVVQAAKENNINGIFTIATDKPMNTVAAVSEQLNLVGINTETAKKATNKFYMREALRIGQVPIPDYMYADNKEVALDCIKKFIDNYKKCIVKPIDSSGSRGVCLLDSYSEELARKTIEYALSYSNENHILIEEYIDGVEVSVETLSINGTCNVIQITDKITTGAPYFVELGHTQPSRLSKDIQNAIKKIAKRTCEVIGVLDGPSHIEIKVSNNEPKVIEMGARLGGDNITTHLVPLSTGINIVDLSIKNSMGESFDLEKSKNAGSAIRYILPDIGIIKSIEGKELASKMKGVEEIQITKKIGDMSSVIRNSIDRVGYVIASGENADDAEKNCLKALEEIKIGVES